MLIGLGVDVFEVSRMERALHEGDPGFTHDLFTPAEIAYCQRQRDPIPHFAARFVVKEAVFKALSLNDEEPVPWRDVEVRIHESGDVNVALHGRLEQLAAARGVGRVLISITRARGLAMAGAILESRHD